MQRVDANRCGVRLSGTSERSAVVAVADQNSGIRQVSEGPFPDVASCSDRAGRQSPKPLRLHVQEIRHSNPIHDALRCLQQGCELAIFVGLNAYAELHTELSAM
jgi:hypothetical protein